MSRGVVRERRSPQISRIARLLEVEADQVTGLDGLSDEDLRTLHDQISRSLFADGQARFARVAGLSKTIPGPLAGKLAEKFLPPVLAARVSELLEPARARDLVNRVRVGYLADIAIALDPVRSRPVVQALPAKRIGEVAREMFGRGEYVVMAEFVNTVTLDALVAALHEATPHDLLAVVPLLEWNDNLDRVIATLPERQVREIVASLDHAELADLALALDPSRFGPIIAFLDADVVAEIARALFSRGEHAAMASMTPLVTREMLEAALGVARGEDLVAVLPLLEWTDDVDAVVLGLPPEQVRGILDEVTPTDLADLALAVDPKRFAPIVAHVDPAVVAEIASELFSRGEHRAMARLAPVVTVEMLDAALGVAEGGDLLAVVPHLRWNKSLAQVFAGIPDKRLDALLAQMVDEGRWTEGGAVLKKLDAQSRERIVARVPHLSPARRTALDSALSAGAIIVDPALAEALGTLVAAAEN